MFPVDVRLLLPINPLLEERPALHIFTFIFQNFAELFAIQYISLKILNTQLQYDCGIIMVNQYMLLHYILGFMLISEGLNNQP